MQKNAVTDDAGGGVVPGAPGLPRCVDESERAAGRQARQPERREAIILALASLGGGDIRAGRAAARRRRWWRVEARAR